MADVIIPDGNANRTLNADDFTAQGETKTVSADLALVVQSASIAEQWIANKQWNLMWRDSDLLYQSPRPMTVFENTYILEPNVQRFTVAKVCNAVVPQLYKGLFYADPPMILRPRPGTSQTITDAKTALFSYLFDACNFKRETKWGLEQMAHLGTGVWKWGIEYVEVQKPVRKSTVVKIKEGQNTSKVNTSVVTTDAPNVTMETRIVPRPFINYREISHVLVDPHLKVSDIREADFVIDVWYVDWYQLRDIKKNIVGTKDEADWDIPDNLKDLWIDPALGLSTSPVTLRSDQQSQITGIVHHSQDINIKTSPDPLRKKLEILEYWDKGRKILVLDRKKVIYTGENPFNQIPFLSANWWNRRKAFYGMGLGLIVGQNQRVDQGTINAILKILSFGVNPLYLRRRDAGGLSQMIRTNLGKILTVDVQPGRPASDAYSLMEMPKVPGDIWAALAESEKATESSSGADSMLVQGSSAGPRTSMVRTATGATQMAGASATRLDGPLDNFIEQVFKPFLYILDYLVFNFMPDSEILEILGEELGKDFEIDLQEFHDAKHQYEVLAGASLAAKRIMAQSMTLITQIFENPQIQQNLAEINEEYLDFKPILKMWMEASEWKNVYDIIKPLTPRMKQMMQQKSEAAQAQSKAAISSNLENQKFQNKSELNQQTTDARLQRDLVLEAFRNSAETEDVSGQPSSTGLEGEMPNVE